MSKKYLVFACVLILALLNGCGEKPTASIEHQQVDLPQATTEQTNDPPVIEHLDTYPFPIPPGWNEEKFQVIEYDEGMEWEAVFTFEQDEQEQALAYKEVIEGLGYETQTLLQTVFKIGSAEFAGILYHGTFTFDIGDEYSEWGHGQGYVEITFSEKR